MFYFFFLAKGRLRALSLSLFFFFKKKTEYDIGVRLVGSEMCIRDSYYYEGYQTAEIAALPGRREGSVRSRLTRARTRLRQVLKGEDE